MKVTLPLFSPAFRVKKLSMSHWLQSYRFVFLRFYSRSFRSFAMEMKGCEPKLRRRHVRRTLASETPTVTPYPMGGRKTRPGCHGPNQWKEEELREEDLGTTPQANKPDHHHALADKAPAATPLPRGWKESCGGQTVSPSQLQ